MPKLRIAFDTRDLFLSKTGIKTVLVELLAELETMNDIEIIRIQPGHLQPPSTKLAKSIEHIRFFIWKQVQLPIKAKKANADALICNDYMVPIMAFGVKTYPIFHGINFWLYPKHYNKWWLKYFSFFSIKGARRAKRIFTVSEFTKGELGKRLRFSKEKITVLHNGPRRRGIDEQPGILEKLKIKQGNYLFFVGVLEKRKNLPNLIKGYSKVRTNLPLVIAGQQISKSGIDDFPNIEAVIEELGLKQKVILPGHVSDSELVSLFKNASLFVFPSTYEGFGIPVLEAFQYRVPVVAARSSALPEVIGDKGVYFDPKEPEDIARVIEEVLKEDSVRLQLVENGNDRLKHFNWSRTARKLVEIISDDIKAF